MSRATASSSIADSSAKEPGASAGARIGVGAPMLKRTSVFGVATFSQA